MDKIEIAIDKEHKDRIPQFVETLMDEGYVCMLSYEENLVIINAIWTELTDRNGVSFMSAEEFDMHYIEIEKEED